MPRQESKFVHVERGNSAENLQPRNINIGSMDVIVFIFYANEMVVDVETGIVKK